MAEQRRPVFRQASLDDPDEYRGGRRLDFWEVIKRRARKGAPYAQSILADRAAWLDKLRALAEREKGLPQ
jgi:hypothetical protein